MYFQYVCLFNSAVCPCRRDARQHQSLQGRAGGRDLSGERGNRRRHPQTAGWLVGRQVWSTQTDIYVDIFIISLQ